MILIREIFTAELCGAVCTDSGCVILFCGIVLLCICVCCLLFRARERRRRRNYDARLAEMREKERRHTLEISKGDMVRFERETDRSREL
ncbi:MAG: hypothetical protein VB092_02645 [Oscillospiraceae bacterium]|nr:hypothetical protein [Oscillospiraceae bacterium]